MIEGAASHAGHRSGSLSGVAALALLLKAEVVERTMAVYLVTCEFQADGDQGERLARRLVAHGEFRQLGSGSWLLQAEGDATEMLEDLSTCISGQDKLLIARLQGDAAWEGYGRQLGDWVTDVLLGASG